MEENKKVPEPGDGQPKENSENYYPIKTDRPVRPGKNKSGSFMRRDRRNSKSKKKD